MSDQLTDIEAQLDSLLEDINTQEAPDSQPAPAARQEAPAKPEPQAAPQPEPDQQDAADVPDAESDDAPQAAQASSEAAASLEDQLQSLLNETEQIRSDSDTAEATEENSVEAENSDAGTTATTQTPQATEESDHAETSADQDALTSQLDALLADQAQQQIDDETGDRVSPEHPDSEAPPTARDTDEPETQSTRNANEDGDVIEGGFDTLDKVLDESTDGMDVRALEGDFEAVPTDDASDQADVDQATAPAEASRETVDDTDTDADMDMIEGDFEAPPDELGEVESILDRAGYIRRDEIKADDIDADPQAAESSSDEVEMTPGLAAVAAELDEDAQVEVPDAPAAAEQDVPDANLPVDPETVDPQAQPTVPDNAQPKQSADAPEGEQAASAVAPADSTESDNASATSDTSVETRPGIFSRFARLAETVLRLINKPVDMLLTEELRQILGYLALGTLGMAALIWVVNLMS